MRTRTTAAAAALITVLTASTSPASPAGAAAGPGPVRVGQLERGPAPAVLWQDANVVHTARGREVRLPWTRKGARRHVVRVLGRVEGDWLVKAFDGGDTWRVWRVDGDRRSEVERSSVSEGSVVTWRLADDRRRLLRDYFDGDRVDTLTVRDLIDRPLRDSRDFEDVRTGVLDFSGGEVVVGTSPTQVWNVGLNTVEVLPGDAVGASFEHDVVFLSRPGSGVAGPTPLSDPGPPAWTAPMSRPVVSPDGVRVLSLTGRRGDRVQVRDLATGVVRSSFVVRHLASDTPVWESNRSFVLVGALDGAGEREALVRCSIGRGCRRVSAVRPAGTLSLPVR